LQKTGELGIGKTLTLSYLAWNNWYFKKRIIATNYTVYGIPHQRITSINQFFQFIPEESSEKEILEGNEKWFGGDDFWRWISSRTFGMGAKEKNDVIGRILIASRKAKVTVTYSTQLFSMIDKNVRQITDLLMKPVLSPDMSYCKVYVYGIIEGKMVQPMQPFYFNTESIYAIYNTYERVMEITNNKDDNTPLLETTIPIKDNPAWKKYCRDMLNVDIESDHFKEVSDEILTGLKRGL
jgi:hypothetical protein